MGVMRKLVGADGGDWGINDELIRASGGRG